MTLNARAYTAGDRATWDDLIHRSHSGHFFFLRGYLEYHADRFVDASALVFDGNRLVAALPANRADDQAVSHGGLTFGGVIADRGVTSGSMLRIFDSLREWLLAEAVSGLIYKPVPHVYHVTPGEEDLFALFRHGARLVARDLSAAILLEERLPYSKGRSAALRRARDTGLAISSSTAYAEFIELVRLGLERHDAVPTHTSDEIAFLAGRFPENIRLVTASLRGELVAGVLVYETPAVAHTQYIASSEHGKSLGAVDVLLDRLIEHYSNTKRWFEFGISTTAGGRDLNVGLMRNKESYGARAVVYDRYLLDV